MATNIDLTKFTREEWNLMIQAELEALPSLRGTIMNVNAPGMGIVHLPYVSGLVAAHAADGDALTYQAGTATGIDITVDKHPTTPILLGKLATMTADPGAPGKFALAAATSIRDYESALIATTIVGMAPAAGQTLTLNLKDAGVTTRQGIGDGIAGALGLAAGKLDAAKLKKTNRWILVNPALAGYALTTEQFASANFSGILGQVANSIDGLIGAAGWLGMGIIVHPSVTATYTGGGTLATTTSIHVYQEEVAGIAWCQDIEMLVERSSMYNCNQIVADAVFGVAAGRTSCLCQIDVTLDGNPLSL